MQFEDWVEQAYSSGASDVHLEADTPLVARIRGELKAVGAPVSGSALKQVARDLLGAARWPEFLERGSADIAESVRGIRIRANLFQTVRGIAVAIRLLAPSVKDLRVCNLHQDFGKLIEAQRLDPHLRADRIGKIHHACGADRRDQRDARAQRADSGKPDRVPVCKPAILHPATGDSDPFAEF